MLFVLFLRLYLKRLDLGHAILTTFRDFGYRYNPRSKCRLMFLINDMGLAAFRDEVARRYRERAGEDLPRAGASLVPAVWARRELLGAHKQRDGRNWVGVRVPAGRVRERGLLRQVCQGGLLRQVRGRLRARTRLRATA